MPIYIVAIMLCKEGKREETLALLGALEKGSRAEQGNLQYDVTEALDKPGKFYIIERWQSKEAIDIHGATDHFTQFQAIKGSVIAESSVQLLTSIGE